MKCSKLVLNRGNVLPEPSKWIKDKQSINDNKMGIDFREKGIKGLKSKKRGRPSKMSKSQNKSKDRK